jgi:hypothetical protein
MAVILGWSVSKGLWGPGNTGFNLDNRMCLGMLYKLFVLIYYFYLFLTFEPEACSLI